RPQRRSPGPGAPPRVLGRGRQATGRWRRPRLATPLGTPRRPRAVSSAAPATADLDPAAAMDQLAQSRSPLLIGVRHHSPAGAAAIPALLSSVQPELLMVELPEEMQEWMPWLAHAELQAPIALAAVRK